MTPKGTALPVEVLSRGTARAIVPQPAVGAGAAARAARHRFAAGLGRRAGEFRRRAARAAAEVLCEFAARGHQLLVFTCHEHIYQLFRSLNAAVRELPANPRVLAMRGLVAEQEAPRTPIMPLAPPAARPTPIEVIEPAPLPTNGHSHEHDVAPVLPPPLPCPRSKLRRHRARSGRTSSSTRSTGRADRLRRRCGTSG